LKDHELDQLPISLTGTRLDDCEQVTLAEMRTMGGRPLVALQSQRSQPEDTDQFDLKHFLRVALSPRISCIVGVVFCACLSSAAVVTVVALMPNPTTTTTTTTTTSTASTTTSSTSSSTTTSSTSGTFTSTTMTITTVPPTDQVIGPGKQVALRGSDETGATTTGKPGTASVSLSMIVQNLDYVRLMARPGLHELFEGEVKGDIVEQAGHGVQPNDVQLALQEGSVHVQATIGSLQPPIATAVAQGLQSSALMLGQKVAASVGKVEGLAALATGPIAVTDVATHVNGVPKPQPPPKPPSPGFPWLLVFLILGAIVAVLGLVAVGVFLVRRRSAESREGYLAASKEERGTKEGATPKAKAGAKAAAKSPAAKSLAARKAAASSSDAPDDAAESGEKPSEEPSAGSSGGKAKSPPARPAGSTPELRSPPKAGADGAKAKPKGPPGKPKGPPSSPAGTDGAKAKPKLPPKPGAKPKGPPGKGGPKAPAKAKAPPKAAPE